jgi:hypothetical protein
MWTQVHLVLQVVLIAMDMEIVLILMMGLALIAKVVVVLLIGVIGLMLEVVVSILVVYNIRLKLVQEVFVQHLVIITIVNMILLMVIINLDILLAEQQMVSGVIGVMVHGKILEHVDNFKHVDKNKLELIPEVVKLLLLAVELDVCSEVQKQQLKLNILLAEQQMVSGVIGVMAHGQMQEHADNIRHANKSKHNGIVEVVKLLLLAVELDVCSEVQKQQLELNS